MALHHVAAQHPESAQLVRRGDPLGHHLHVEGVGELDDGAHDWVVVAVGPEHAGDCAVELENVGFAGAQRSE